MGRLQLVTLVANVLSALSSRSTDGHFNSCVCSPLRTCSQIFRRKDTLFRLLKLVCIYIARDLEVFHNPLLTLGLRTRGYGTDTPSRLSCSVKASGHFQTVPSMEWRLSINQESRSYHSRIDIRDWVGLDWKFGDVTSGALLALSRWTGYSLSLTSHSSNTSTQHQTFYLIDEGDHHRK